MDLTTASPSEIDTKLAELYRDISKARQMLDSLMAKDFRGVRRGSDQQISEANAALSEALVATRPYDIEYGRRPWTRVFVVPGGHAHRSMACHTLYADTLINWMPAWSGKDEAEIVDAAADRACTVCYPSAPVNKPTTLFTADEAEERARLEQVRAERAAKAAAKAAKAITMPDGTPLRDEYSVIGTEVSAQRTAVEMLANRLWYGQDHPSYTKWSMIADDCITALAHKRGLPYTEVRDDMRKRAETKHAKDKRESEKQARALGL